MAKTQLLLSLGFICHRFYNSVNSKAYGSFSFNVYRTKFNQSNIIKIFFDNLRADTISRFVSLALYPQWGHVFVHGVGLRSLFLDKKLCKSFYFLPFSRSSYETTANPAVFFYSVLW